MEKYGIKAKCVILVLLLFLASAHVLVKPANANLGIGYWIIVEGAYFHLNQMAITYGCMSVRDTLRGVGYSDSRIHYLGLNATRFTLNSSVREWAAGLVKEDEPLWIYMFDHGGDNHFRLRGGQIMNYSWLNTLINQYIPQNVNTIIIIAACFSGSAIDDFNHAERVIITSSTSDQESRTYNDIKGDWEAFSEPFWDEIKEYNTVTASFNFACYSIKNIQTRLPQPTQDPLLDDDGNGTGHTGPLPNGGDGYNTSALHIGSHAYTTPRVGGFSEPVDKLSILAPYIIAAALAAAAATAVYLKHTEHRRKKQ